MFLTACSMNMVSLRSVIGCNSWAVACNSDQASQRFHGPGRVRFKTGTSETQEPITPTSRKLVISDPKSTEEQWINQLTEILQSNPHMTKARNSTAYSRVNWKEIEPLFNRTPYVQETRSIDEEKLDVIEQYLTDCTKAFGPIEFASEAQRLSYITPILVNVCGLLNGDARMVAEENSAGNVIRAHGRLDLTVRRGNKVVCIVEAKRDDLEQGWAQALVGCQVAIEDREGPDAVYADREGPDALYAIVTNYSTWQFFRIIGNKVELDECSLFETPEGPTRDSLKQIVEKIYWIFSSEESRKGEGMASPAKTDLIPKESGTTLTGNVFEILLGTIFCIQLVCDVLPA